MKRFLKKSVSMLLLVALVLTLLCGAALAATVKGSNGKSYIRKSPNLNGEILGTFPKGASAERLDTSTDNRGVAWYKIKYKGITGWVSSMYTSCGSTSAGVSSNGSVWATGGTVNIRSSASKSGKIIGTFPKGERANYLTQKEDGRGVVWYKITYGTTTGWVSAMYTSRNSKDSGSGSGTKSSGKTVVASRGSTYIRSSASLNGKKVSSLPKGASASYLGESKRDDREVVWYKVKYKGKTGWVSSRYTTLK